MRWPSAPRKSRVIGGATAALTAATVLWVPAPVAAHPGGPTGPVLKRVSVDARGGQADSTSNGPTLSADGRFVAFNSGSTNLVPGDTNGVSDIFVRDRRFGRTSRISLAPGGGQADGSSYNPVISADGRWVAFTSYATNLAPGTDNGVGDVFVHDRVTRSTRLVSRGLGGVPADGDSTVTGLSADGRWVAFGSYATNLVPGDVNGFGDAFVHDLRTGRTDRVSVASDGIEGDHVSLQPVVSDSGRWVTFTSYAENLVPGDSNGFADVFLRDRATGRTRLVSRGLGGVPGDEYSASATISADGRHIAFWSFAGNLVPGDSNGAGDIYVADRRTGRISRVSVASDGTQADHGSHRVAVNADGRYVAFSSYADNLVPGDVNGFGDVFVHDRRTGVTSLVSVSTSGVQANQDSASNLIAISGDGRHVGFTSEATNLVPGDTNGADDVFVQDRSRRSPARARG